MATVNVNRNVTDAFYRYKMPKIMAKVEGKGNGIKTVIMNMVEVARALGRPPTYTTKYFGCELGALTRVDGKNDRYIVNGSHDATKLQTLLDGFIKRYVLCPECENPETVLRVSTKKQMITRTCKACGNQSDVDMTHKLTAFILKNPPDESKKSRNGGGTEAADAEQFDESPPCEVDSGDDGDWSVDVSPEAVKRRMEDLSNGVKGLAITDDLDKTEKERIDMLYEFVKRKRADGKLGVAGVDKEILNEAERLEVKDKGPLVLAELLLDNSILSQIKQYRVIFLRFCHENPKAQKYLLGGVEQIIALNKATLLPKIVHILKALYDADILEEEVILDWGRRASKKYVSKDLSEEMHAKAKPFLDWLENAEESSDEEDSDDESDVEIAYDDRVTATKLKQAEEKKPTPTLSNGKANGTAADHEDDFDIDAI
jgi:translation initiation factor 5